MTEKLNQVPTKSAYVAIIGKPNVGKSTLINSLVGSKLSIVSPKPQTTRKKVMGIFTEENTQIVFLDTPGLLNPKYKMQEKLMEYVDSAVEESDVLLVMLDVSKYKKWEDYFPEKLINMLTNCGKPVILAINKIDTKKDVKSILPIILEASSKNIFTDIVPICATHNENTKKLIEIIEKFMPEQEFFYDPELLSTQPQRFFVSEIIREVIFKCFKEEIPYSTEVQIIEFKERDFGKWYISAEIIIERDGQKAIVIGNKGEKLKEIGEKSRKAIEEYLEMGVFLEIFVKVRKDWRESESMLRNFGY